MAYTDNQRPLKLSDFYIASLLRHKLPRTHRIRIEALSPESILGFSFFRVIANAAVLLAGFCVVSGMSACATLEGYPEDPGNDAVVLASLKPYFDASSEDNYTKEGDAAKRRQMRDDIALHRIRAYDIKFSEFEKSLLGYGNGYSTGSDLVLLVLNGFATVVGGASTKTALSAASAGVIGAQGAINKDLYYQKTLPALLAQMEANRTRAKLAIFSGLTQDDSKYSLARLNLDLETLKSASGISSAITNISEQAVSAANASQSKIDALRTQTFSSSSTTSQKLRAWLYPPAGLEVDANGNSIDPDETRIALLQEWMNGDAVDPTLKSIPVEALVDGSSPDMESARARAIADKKLNIQ